jgi:hypothetical protein
MALIVTGYVDGEPIYFEEPEPTQYEATAEVEEKSQYEVGITATDEFENSTTVNQMFYVAGEWIEPIWQRTQADVDKVTHLLNKVSAVGWDNLTTEEQSTWFISLIGCLNYWDLNRIEQNTKYLTDYLLDHGYSTGNKQFKVSWELGEHQTYDTLERIRTNVVRLVDGYYPVVVTVPATLSPPTFKNINDIEHVLKLLKEMIHRMEQSFRYSGTFFSGQGVAF